MLNKLNIKWYDWLIIAGILLIVIVNPFTGMYVTKAMEWMLEQVAKGQSIVVSVAGTLIVVGYIANKVDSRSKQAKHLQKLSKSSHKPKQAGKYLTV